MDGFGNAQDQRRVQRARQMRLSRELEEAQQLLGATRRRVGAQEWCHELLLGSVVDGEQKRRHGHRGFLFDLFQLRHRYDEEFFRGMASLVCESSVEECLRLGW